MGIKVEIKPDSNALAAIPFRWDSETEILSGSIEGLATVARCNCTVELEDTAGAVVSLDVADGLLCGIEVVVWPTSEVVPNIRAPDVTRRGAVFVPSAAQDDLPVVEVDTPLGCELAPDESVIHVTVGKARVAQSVAVAKNLLVDLDAGGAIAGLWLLNVPPFATPEGINV